MISQSISQRYRLSPSVMFKVWNFLAFQTTWLLCIFYGDTFIAVCAGLIALHFVLSPSKRTDVHTMFTVAAIGLLVDMCLASFGLYQFENVFFPLWLIALWLAFSLTLSHSLGWIKALPARYQALLGTFGGTSSYFAAYKLGAVEFPADLSLTLGIIAAAWACMFPLFYSIQRLQK